MSMLIPNVEELFSAEHRYRKLLHVVDRVELARPLRVLYSNLGRRGYPVETAVTPGNVPDSRAFSMIAPSQGAVLGDKAYGDDAAQQEMGRIGLHSLAIKNRTLGARTSARIPS